MRSRDLFAGRIAQIERVLEAIATDGCHAVIYGGRGVGKTSLANLIHAFWIDRYRDHDISSVRITCESADNFQFIWYKVIQELVDRAGTSGVLFSHTKEEIEGKASSVLSGQATAYTIERFFSWFGGSLIVILDEFDRLKDDDETEITQFSDTIKMLSDHAVDVTLVIVGVADTVEQLIKAHESIPRSLVQVHMPYMSTDELREIVEKGYRAVGMDIHREPLRHIAFMCQGLPHYAHLLGLHAADHALHDSRTRVTKVDLPYALGKAIEDTRESTQTTYAFAVQSPRKNIFREVLLACALTAPDSLGFFAPSDVVPVLSKIRGQACPVPSFARHLVEFSGAQRGRVLEAVGQRYRKRYRFAAPVIRPYIVQKGLADGLIDMSWFTRRSSRSEQV